MSAVIQDQVNQTSKRLKVIGVPFALA